MAKCCMCPKTFTPRNLAHRCCSYACVTSLHNLRKARGEAVYDLLMQRASHHSQRYLLSDIDRLVRGWISEDAKAGRRTYRRPPEA